MSQINITFADELQNMKTKYRSRKNIFYCLSFMMIFVIFKFLAFILP